MEMKSCPAHAFLAPNTYFKYFLSKTRKNYLPMITESKSTAFKRKRKKKD